MLTIDTMIEPSDILLKQLLEDDAILVDVRTIHEFAGFHLPKAHNIPYEELLYHLEQIKNWDKPIIIYCMEGRRSQLVTEALKREGIEVYDAGSQERVMRLLKAFNLK